MIPNGPVEEYLRHLRRALPYPAPRLVAETREHLEEATSAARARGRSKEEAEAEAVRNYGPVNDVVAAVLTDGSALMSPTAGVWVRVFAVMLCLPTALFVAVNVIETLAGNDGGVGVFGATFDSWRSQINALLIFGPLIALALIVLTGIRVTRERGVNGFAANIEIRMSKWSFRAAVLILIVAVAVIAYGVIENYSTWRDFHNQSWTCTTTPEGQQVCYEGNYPLEP